MQVELEAVTVDIRISREDGKVTVWDQDDLPLDEFFAIPEIRESCDYADLILTAHFDDRAHMDRRLAEVVDEVRAIAGKHMCTPRKRERAA